jgi:hypothetical protein
LKKKSKLSISEDTYEKEVAPSADKQNEDSSYSLQSNISSNSYPEPPEHNQSSEAPDLSDENTLQSDNSLKLIHISDIIKQPIKTNWLIDGCLTESSLAFMFGNPASGKSFIALEMAFCIAHGIDWHDHPVNQGTVIYIAGEGYAGLQKRIQGLCLKYGIDHPENFFISNQAIDLNNTDSMNELAGILPKECNIELIIIDTLNRNCSADENSAKEMSKVIHHCDILKSSTGASILVVHHSGHSTDNRVRGSSSIKGAIDVELMVSKKESDITLKNTKMKDFNEFEPLSFEIQSIDVGETDEGDSISSAILLSKAFEPEAPDCSDKDIDLLHGLSNLMALNGLTVANDDEFLNAAKQPVKLDNIHKKISRKDWFNHCKDDIKVNSKSNPDEAKRKSFDRSVKKLLNTDRIAINDDKFLIIQEPTV